MILSDLINKKIIAVRGFRFETKRMQGFEPEYILFDDEKTILELEEQDISFHNCNSSARTLYIRQNPKKWKRIMEDTWNYPIADC